MREQCPDLSRRCVDPATVVAATFQPKVRVFQPSSPPQPVQADLLGGSAPRLLFARTPAAARRRGRRRLLKLALLRFERRRVVNREQFFGVGNAVCVLSGFVRLLVDSPSPPGLVVDRRARRALLAALLLAIHAIGGERQDLQALNRNFVLTLFAYAVAPAGQPAECVVDRFKPILGSL